MHSLNVAPELLAPLPFLPLISVLAIVVGVVLIFGRNTLGLVSRRVRPAMIRKTRSQGTSGSDLHPAVAENAGPRSIRGPRGLFLMTLWFGLLAGWLELGLVLALRAVNPHVSLDMLRTNRHFVWMIPVSDALIFGGVGLLIASLARSRRLAWWTTLRLPIGLSFLTLLLTIEGLNVVGAITLACGLASIIGPWLERRAGAAFGRLVLVSLPAMAVGLIVLTGVTYDRVTSAEVRAMSLRPPAKPGVPNVLLIVLDNVRAASLSLYGHRCPTSPTLERLALQGRRLLWRPRSTAPWTLPSHASMMTGRWPYELSAGWDRPLDGKFPTLAEALEREGYATAGFVGNIYYCSGTLFGLGRGFARYDDAYENQTVSLFETVRSSGLGRRVVQALGYPIRLEDGETSVRKTAAMLNRDVLGWLAGRPADRPFFVFVNHYYDAHRPYVIPGDSEPRFGMAATLPLAERVEIDKRFMGLAGGKPVPADLANQQVVNDGFNLYRNSYHSCIAYLDRQVGILLDEIERRGLLSNTLVILTSDHGEQLGEHGAIAHGASLYRPEVHVPLLVIPPSRSSTTKTVDEPVSIREIPATVAEWVDMGPQNPFTGPSLARFVNGGSARRLETSTVLCEVEHSPTLPRTAQIPSSLGRIRSLVSRDRVYIRIEGVREELYDRVHDELESVDLAGYPESRPVICRFREELSRLVGGATTTKR